jgi:hypothetical protein
VSGAERIGGGVERIVGLLRPRPRDAAAFRARALAAVDAVRRARVVTAKDERDALVAVLANLAGARKVAARLRDGRRLAQELDRLASDVEARRDQIEGCN